VVVVDYDGEDVLPKCLGSLARTVPSNISLTVIDNASHPPSESLVPEELRGRVEKARLERNVGYAGAIEKAWSIGEEGYLVIANNDIEFTPGWLDAMVATAEATGASAVSAVIEHENKTELEKATNAGLSPLLYLIPGVFKDRTKAVYPSGACFLLRREKDQPAPVDPDYFLYYEDVYIGFLNRSLGKTVVQCPEARVRHMGSHSVRRSNRERIAFLQERNRLITQILFFDFGTLLGLSPLILADSLLKIPQCVTRGKPVIPTVQAHFWVLFSIGTILRKRAALRKLADFGPRRILPYLTGKVLPPSARGARFWNSISKGWCRMIGLPVDREAADVSD
jgi:N-acetylglucosaminyl-diphospho-decaprenol L-rhamnosyltransferase